MNSYTTKSQRSPALAIHSGGFVITWRSNDQDGSGYGIFAQRFAKPPLAILDIDGDGTLGADRRAPDPRFLFGFTGATLTSGAVGGSCSRCDAATIEVYLQTLT